MTFQLAAAIAFAVASWRKKEMKTIAVPCWTKSEMAMRCCRRPMETIGVKALLDRLVFDILFCSGVCAALQPAQFTKLCQRSAGKPKQQGLERSFVPRAAASPAFDQMPADTRNATPLVKTNFAQQSSASGMLAPGNEGKSEFIYLLCVRIHSCSCECLLGLLCSSWSL